MCVCVLCVCMCVCACVCMYCVCMLCVHTHARRHTHPHTHTYTLSLSLETPSLPQPSIKGVYPPNQGILSNLFTSIELRPGRRTPRGVDGSQIIAGTRVKMPGPGASTTLWILWCVCIVNPCCWLARPTQGTPDLTWSPSHGQDRGAAISHIVRQADDALPCPPWGHTHTHTLTCMHSYLAMPWTKAISRNQVCASLWLVCMV